MRIPRPIVRNELAWIFWLTFALLLALGLISAIWISGRAGG